MSNNILVSQETFNKLLRLYTVAKSIRPVRGGIPGDKLEMCGSEAFELMSASDSLDDFFRMQRKQS